MVVRPDLTHHDGAVFGTSSEGGPNGMFCLVSTHRVSLGLNVKGPRRGPESPKWMTLCILSGHPCQALVQHRVDTRLYDRTGPSPLLRPDLHLRRNHSGVNDHCYRPRRNCRKIAPLNDTESSGIITVINKFSDVLHRFSAGSSTLMLSTNDIRRFGAMASTRSHAELVKVDRAGRRAQQHDAERLRPDQESGQRDMPLGLQAKQRRPIETSR